MDLAWLDDVMRRVQELHRSYNVLNRRLTHRNEKRKMVQNVLIDGHNLAFRCMYAPGMSRLSDSQGRPTGLIVGFLRSLGALRKKYPTARFWVTWDGSSQRRKSSFADYKANRPVREADESGFDQMAYVRKVIVYLGVTQAFNPEEEADDVIGALVKGDLVSQKNVIFSSDKDLLQLVTHDTFLLIPAIGSRKEILFEGPEIVEEYMGVPPGKMVEFRALCGDPSDNIPGVPRVPKKVLRALIQAHGSVDGIYKSGLAGLTRNQYDRLRSAEPQVRINLELMALVDVEVSLTYPDVNSSVAQQLMEEVGIKPQPILKAFGL
jgi:DNA polymerase-1